MCVRVCVCVCVCVCVYVAAAGAPPPAPAEAPAAATRALLVEPPADAMLRKDGKSLLNIRSVMLTYAHVCSRMLTYADGC